MVTETFNRLYLKGAPSHSNILILLPLILGEGARGRLVRPSCDAEFARALKVFYHSMTSVRAQLQRLHRHRPSVRLQPQSYCILIQSRDMVFQHHILYFHCLPLCPAGGVGPARAQAVCGRAESSAEGLLGAAGAKCLHTQTRCSRYCSSQTRAVRNLVLT